MAKTTKRKRTGRPGKYSELTASRICKRLAAGESLRAICKDRGMPNEATVRGWALGEHTEFTEFAGMFKVATQIKAARWGDELIELCDEPPLLVDGRVDLGWVQAQRLKVHTRQWVVSRMLPKVFGDRLALTGQEGAPPIKLSNEDAAREVSMLLATAAARKVQAEREAAAAAVEDDGDSNGNVESTVSAHQVQDPPGGALRSAPLSGSKPAQISKQKKSVSYDVPAEWVGLAQARWTLPSPKPNAAVAGCALTDDGMAVIVGRAGQWLDEPTAVLQGVSNIRKAAGTTTIVMDISQGALLCGQLRKAGMNVIAMDTVIDRARLGEVLREALDPGGANPVALPPGEFDKYSLLAVAMALSIEQAHIPDWQSEPMTYSERGQQCAAEHDPYKSF